MKKIYRQLQETKEKKKHFGNSQTIYGSVFT